jgi:hypothetical protein
LKLIEHWPRSRETEVTVRLQADCVFTMSFVPLFDSKRQLDMDPGFQHEGHSGWLLYFETERFRASPSRSALVDVLRKAAVEERDNVPWLTRSLPWIVSACLHACKDSRDLLGLADRAEAGELGDTKDWRLAEQRWIEKGLTLSDFEYATDEHWPFDKNIGEVGLPFTPGYSDSRLSLNLVRDKIFDLFTKCQTYSNLRSELASWIVLNTLSPSPMLRNLLEPEYFYRIPIWLTPETLTTLLRLSRIKVMSLGLIERVLERFGASDSWLKVFDAVVQDDQISLNWFHGIHTVRDPLQQNRALRSFESNADKVGLLRIILHELLYGAQANVSGIKVEAEQLKSPCLREAAIVIILANHETTVAQAETLAVLTSDLGESGGNAVRYVRSVTSEREMFTEALAAYFLKLRNIFEPTQWEAGQEIIEALNDLFRRKKSRLDDPDVYQGTNLPDGLLDLLAPAA